MQKIASSPLLQSGVFLLFVIFLPLHPVYAAGGKMKVIASIVPLADFAKQVGGDKTEVILLLPPGASPHTYEPTPKVIREISQAKVFLKIGSGLEFWADRIIQASSASIDVMDASAGIALFPDAGYHPHTGEKHLPVNTDPHIWLDPVNCIDIVSKIETAFSKADPSHSLYYKKNAEAYREKLRQLDQEISERTKLFRIRKYVTFHPAWNYFSRRYGLTVSAVIEEGPGKEPAPRHMRRIIEELRKLDTRIIFAEPQFSPRIAETIARESGATLLFLDPLGGQKNTPTYIELMKHNLTVMEDALK